MAASVRWIRSTHTHRGWLARQDKGAAASAVQLWYPSEWADFSTGGLIYCFRASAAWSMIYLRPGSNESFDTRWMGRTWAASALLTGPQAGSRYSQDMIWCLFFCPGGWITCTCFLHETDTNLEIFNADQSDSYSTGLTVNTSLLCGLFTSQPLLLKGKELPRFNLRVSLQWVAGV